MNPKFTLLNFNHLFKKYYDFEEIGEEGIDALVLAFEKDVQKRYREIRYSLFFNNICSTKIRGNDWMIKFII